ncbi:DUF6457 domain-containing protein [Gulosibacter chungangensis]|uniref:DUF6457 domain-containing protein n=1 Tax=Gulosibacter chungangensis TaxID=979746 RepID=A0A7J5BHC0_9MICO|nr:DUF6457 domain-containing protein [Gulosibacter chungangensis]KAB1644809.1 hypothetical protein F8O05_00575 [Gulosibacter chungangensis]
MTSGARGIPDGLREWVEFAAPQLGVDAAEVPLDALLGMTGIVAHGVVRPAAPVSAYILGLAVGRGTISSNEAGDALLRSLVTQWNAQKDSDLDA